MGSTKARPLCKVSNNDMKRTPTDYALLNVIYERYYDEFAAYDPEHPGRSSKIYMPIDIETIAARLGVDSDIVFGRLYYHLENRYGYKLDDGSFVHFFAIKVGADTHCVNFPYLSSVLATLRDENKKYRLATGIAVASLLLAVLSLGISLVR